MEATVAGLSDGMSPKGKHTPSKGTEYRVSMVSALRIITMVWEGYLLLGYLDPQGQGLKAAGLRFGTRMLDSCGASQIGDTNVDRHDAVHHCHPKLAGDGFKTCLVL